MMAASEQISPQDPVRDARLTAEEMDEQRHEHTAYEYLCHLQETKVWLESCLNEELPPSTELEEALRNGVYLAKLGHRYTPHIVPAKKIYDSDQKRYKSIGLTFRHTDNINYWIASMKELGLPSIFYPETTDLYDRKNCPRVVYCLHALSLFLFRLGAAPQMQDLYGKATFTSEEISAMSEELRKYGLPMPQFRKIGGLLANELPIDEAALHAAILAINDATASQSKDLLSTLQNSAAHLAQHVNPALCKLYRTVLSEALDEKRETAQNRSLSDSYIPDVYDELLTHAEILGHLKACNAYSVLQEVVSAVKANNATFLVEKLQSPSLNLKEVDPNSAEEYLQNFHRELAGLMDYKLGHAQLQKLVKEGNDVANVKWQRKTLVMELNDALRHGHAHQTVALLQKFPSGETGRVLDSAAPLYHEVLKDMQRESEEDFSWEEICSGVKFLNQVAEVNHALEENDDVVLWNTLSRPSLHIQGLEQDNLPRYLHHLRYALRQKVESQGACPFLTHEELQEFVDVVNHQVEADEERLAVLHAINEAVGRSQVKELVELLGNEILGLRKVEPERGGLYLKLLIILKKAKMKLMGEEVELWLEDIKEMMTAAEKHCQEAQQACEALASVHQAAQKKDRKMLAQALQDSSLRLPKLANELIPLALERIAAEIPRFTEERVWIAHRLTQGLPVFLDIGRKRVAWQQPENYCRRALDRQDLEEILLELMAESEPGHLLSRLEPMIIRLQAYSRGFLARERLAAKLEYWATCEEQIVKIQAWWRGKAQRRRYLAYLRRVEEERAAKRQNVGKRPKEVSLLEYFQEHVEKVVVLQRAWRRWKARQQLRSIRDPAHPSVKVLRRFLHLLDLDADDLEEEIRVQDLRGAVVQAIRRNEELEKDLNAMDVKIGLLVRNQIALQDVVAHGHKLKRQAGMKDERRGTLSQNKTEKEPTRPTIGLLAMTKAGRERLEAYQNLFYLLQTQPVYLAKLVFCLPASKTTKFLERAVLTLYNYGSNLREEFLLLKLFRTALSEEIRVRVDSLSDLASGNPLVIKLIVNYNRNGHGLSMLRTMLGPLVKRVIEQKDLYINTNPVEVYKAWINQMESETGKPSGMPYEVTMNQALEQTEVKRRLAHSVVVLQKLTRAFLDAITASVHQLPYGMLYMARVLAEALKEKFPTCPEKDVLKTVGHLLYYRFINSAIVAPDAFDIVQMEADRGLTDDQRRNLGNIAKMLQFAASKKGFGEESPHLICLNAFIIECHEVFKNFFRACTQVPEPEVQFGMDEYTEATLITKPSIYISIQELCDTHQLLVDFEDVVAPNPHDPLHTILEDLGGRPTLGDLVGEDVPQAELQDLARTEIILSLSNRFQLSSEATEAESARLFATTKQLLIRLITCSTANSVKGILEEPVTRQQQQQYSKLVNRLQEHDRTVQENPTFLSRQPSFLRDYRMPLEELKAKVQENLCQLEEDGRVTRHNDYLALLQHIATDILHWRKHREIRAQELHRLLLTNESLNEKTQFYQAQVRSYHDYLQSCLKNLGAGTSKKTYGTLPGSAGKKHTLPTLARPKGTLRYVATKLQAKGVLLEIEGLEPARYKSVLFEISPGAENGRFNVTVQLMGLDVTTVEIDIQNLLQLQYEGVAVFNLCGRAKVNVNLLLYLLQTKFYAKK